jgi:hypothetical protein
MLDPRFKSLRFFFSFIDQEQIIFMVEDYVRWSLFSMMLKCHHLFHLMLEYEVVVD